MGDTVDGGVTDAKGPRKGPRNTGNR